jgi:antibiotic biosynthesis monooxygenase (ABM) superfamily enzyme
MKRYATTRVDAPIPNLLAAYLLYPSLGRKCFVAIRILPVFVTALITMHVSVERMRWQMIPLYGFTIGNAYKHSRPAWKCIKDSVASPSA